MFAIVFSELDYNKLIENRYKCINRTLNENGDGLRFQAIMFIPIDKTKELEELKVNVVLTNTLTF